MPDLRLQLPAPSPAPAAGETPWITVEQAAQLSGKSQGHIRRLCGEKWLEQGKARQVQEAGRKDYWMVRADADPAFVVAPGALAIPAAADLRKLSDAARKKAQERARIVIEWEAYVAAAGIMGVEREDATAQYLAKLPTPTSRATLYNWKAAHKREGLLGLVDGRAIKGEEAAASKEADPFFEEVKANWLTQTGLGVPVCHRMAMATAARQGWTFRSLRATYRFINKFAAENPHAVILHREGEEAFKNLSARHITRDYSELASNEIWNADHHQFDVLVQVSTRLDTASGEMVPTFTRPWLSAWQDLRSRKFVGWIVRATDPNTDAIIESLRLACLAHGVPQRVYTDNGKDFDSQALTGQTKRQRWENRRIHVAHDQQQLGGIYGALGVEHIHAWPYHGQSKPIERAFRTVCERFDKTFDTYCGSNAQERPEQLPAMLKKGRAPTLEQFVEQFATWLEVDYHQRIHTGDSMDTTPAQAWEANLRQKRVAPAEVLEILLQRRIGPVKVGQNGVSFKGIWFGQYELASWFGQDVYLTIDNKQLQSVNVWKADGRFLVTARANLRVSAAATPAVLGEVIKEQKRENKIVRDAARLRPRIHMDRTDRLNEAAGLAAAALPAAPADAPPPSLVPIRNDVEGQMPAVRSGHEVPLKKAVGDDTPAPSRFQYSGQSEESDSPARGFIYHGGSTHLEDQP